MSGLVWAECVSKYAALHFGILNKKIQVPSVWTVYSVFSASGGEWVGQEKEKRTRQR